MGKTLPTPYPGQSIQEYKEHLIKFRNNYWSFLKPSKSGSKLIPLPPQKLINKTTKMTRKINEHVEEELFNKEKRTKPTPPKSKTIKEGDNPVKKKRPYYRKKYNKPKHIEGTIPESRNYDLFVLGVLVGLCIAGLITIIFKFFI